MLPTAEPPFDPIFVDEPLLIPNYEETIISTVGLPFYADVTRPDEVPADERERTIDLAERILRASGVRIGFGHHEKVRTSMESWAPNADEECDADPGYWRSHVLLMSPQEMNFGQLDGEPEERYKKAKTVLAWARECIDSDVLQEIERSQAEDIKQAWYDAAEAELSQREIEQFAEDPPEALDGWTKLDADYDAVTVAYVADNHGTPSVAAVFEGADSELKAREFTLEEWKENDGNPREARPNRFCVTTDGDGAYAQLRSHLLTFEVESMEPLEV
ncbi:hypothetical protein HISP_17530 [Haloarcula hispanica N601]|uniref:Uncharacterized protein n=2 Tax=Haloarcula hispanica TaxID=51589 RepID=V5TT91_HALHI|nr:hypothetical protein [Haloarcula hispanica]AEM59133.1 conserved hypothetical protein [Haloarcula hispanica ATCC 33960]AHB67819.1 hypothetical protein HISP_17530 [Haloarcula hispanica N601]